MVLQSKVVHLMFTILKKKLHIPSENSLNLSLNHLAVVYAFFLPISYYGYARSFIFSLIIILIAFRGNYKYYFTKSFNHPIAIAFLLYAGMYYIWLIGTEDMDYAKWTLHFVKVCLYPFIFYTFLDARFATRILTAMIIGVMLSEVVSYLMFFEIIPWEFELKNVNLPWKDGLTTIGFYKPMHYHDPAPFLSHEIYGPLLALSVTFLVYNLLSTNNSKMTILVSSIFILTMTANIFIVGGRLGHLLFFIMVFSTYFIYKKKLLFKPFIYKVLFLITVFTIAYLSNGIFTKRLYETIHSIEKSYNNIYDFHSSMGGRYGLWYYSLDSIKENLIFGVGTGDQMHVVRENIPEKDSHLKYLITMHSQYFDILIQFGLVGLVIFFNLLYQIIKYDTKNKSYNDIKLYLVFTLFMVGFLSPLFLFFLAMASLLIPALTAHKDILKSNIEPINSKLFSKYALFAIASYFYQQVQ